MVLAGIKENTRGRAAHVYFLKWKGPNTFLGISWPCTGFDALKAPTFNPYGISNNNEHNLLHTYQQHLEGLKGIIITTRFLRKAVCQSLSLFYNKDRVSWFGSAIEPMQKGFVSHSIEKRSTTHGVSSSLPVKSIGLCLKVTWINRWP
jgi:hypothetical protein